MPLAITEISEHVFCEMTTLSLISLSLLGLIIGYYVFFMRGVILHCKKVWFFEPLTA
jgi:hypothetical protein